MEFPAEGIAILSNAFQRNEAAIAMAEESNSWDEGKVGTRVDEKSRRADVHSINPQNAMHGELLNTFIAALQQYQAKYDSLQLKGESRSAWPGMGWADITCTTVTARPTHPNAS